MSTESGSPALLSVRGLHKSFGTNHVLRGIDLDVQPGSVTVLIGPSGSGKTTILRSLNALEIPEAGVVRIAEVTVDYAARPDKRLLARLRAQSGMAFQAHHLFPHMSVLRNVTEGPEVVQRRPLVEVEAEARHLLDQVGLADKAEQYPFELSGGQQQRVGIARALAIKPRLMLFDEPTSSLDPELVGEVLHVMKTLAKEGMTMVVVTHEMGFAAQVADSVVFLDQGEVVARGTPHEIFHNAEHPRLQQFLQNYLDRNAFWQDSKEVSPA